MNRQTTVILFSIVAVLALILFVSEGLTPSTPRNPRVRGPRVLEINQADIQRVSVKRDYWNSFTIKREPDGSWNLVEPSNEPAYAPNVAKLLDTLEFLPTHTTINIPGNDSERYREYGLWEPKEQITLTVSDKDMTLLIGADTKDGNGVYCAVMGQDKVYVTSLVSSQALAADLNAYRASTATTLPTSESTPTLSAPAGVPVMPTLRLQ